MAVYVDSANIDATVGRIRSRWSHLTADTQDELHAFAQRIGLQRRWFQTCKRPCSRAGESCPHWHYDVTTSRRAAAVAAGAVEIDMRAMGDIIRTRREAMRQAAP